MLPLAVTASTCSTVVFGFIPKLHFVRQVFVGGSLAVERRGLAPGSSESLPGAKLYKKAFAGRIERSARRKLEVVCKATSFIERR